MSSACLFRWKFINCRSSGSDCKGALLDFRGFMFRSAFFRGSEGARRTADDLGFLGIGGADPQFDTRFLGLLTLLLLLLLLTSISSLFFLTMSKMHFFFPVSPPSTEAPSVELPLCESASLSWMLELYSTFLMIWTVLTGSARTLLPPPRGFLPGFKAIGGVIGFKMTVLSLGLSSWSMKSV